MAAPIKCWPAYVTGNYFTALGVKPALGRLIAAERGESAGRSSRSLVLGYSYWQKRFGGNPGVIGKQVRVNGKQASIIGVVPQEFQGAIAVMEMDMLLAPEQLRFDRAGLRQPGDGSQCTGNARAGAG